MDAVAALIVLAALAIALFVLGQPLWPGREQATAGRHDLRRADLDAAKIAKYREIRDAELDHATGKLSDEDWRAIDRRLRTDAVEILHALDALGVTSEAPPASSPARGAEATGSAAGPERAD
jgi:membrane protein implicated in regulation of membrane protease activity